MYWVKEAIKRIVGKKALSFYHRFLSWLADLVYGHPSGRLIVIGVTGTNGKSTTVNLIAKILEEARAKVVVSSTVNFRVAEKEWLNDLKMTMPGRFFLQGLLARGLEQGCSFAVLEVTSEGIEQFRHQHIHFDCCVFTNLTPEHIEAHGSFENYKNAKLKLFKHLETLPLKMINGNQIKKVIVVNADDQYAKDFSVFKVDRIVTFGTRQSDVQGENLETTSQGITFNVNSLRLKLKLLGKFDFYNSLAAIAAATGFGFDLDTCKKALERVSYVPGRMEVISGPGFKVLVDYAPEPEGLKQMYETVRAWPKNRVIHVLGSTGGGRDVSRRKILGQIADQFADVVIVTNEDPYDDDPQKIIDDVASGSPKAVKILDRRAAVAYALSQAHPGDLVVITGKGAEQKMAVKGGYISWDDRKVVREELSKLNIKY